MKHSLRIASVLLVLFIAVCFNVVRIHAADEVTPTQGPTPTPDNSAKVSDLNKKISELEGKLHETQTQEQSLSGEIKSMDNNILLTQYRISATQNEVASLGKDIKTANTKISTLESALSSITKILLNRVVATYQAGTIPSIKMIVSSDDFSNYLSRESYLKIVQAHDKKLIYDTQQAKNDYENQKTIFEDKKKKVESLNAQLLTYKTQLDQEKGTKERLLKETQGNEATYQRLIAQAQAQLAGFSNFTASQGGASLLSNQTACDDWGCYYNQRDSQWGGMSLGKYSLASDGCLVTSMAMIYTHYGHRSVTPLTINSDSNNFAAYERAWLLKTITADGASSTRVNQALDSILSSGNPAVVGISYDGGPLADHFVVFVSGSGGSYVMKDPFTPNGNNIDFRGRYPTSRIVEVEKVNF